MTATSAGASRRFTPHLILPAGQQERANAMVLEDIGLHNVRLGCTPIVNLFKINGEPIRVTHRTVNYPVLADARRAYAFEVHSIDSVLPHPADTTGRGDPRVPSVLFAASR